MHDINLNLIKNKPKSLEIKLVNKHLYNFSSYIKLYQLYPKMEVYIRFLDNQEYLITQANFKYYSDHFNDQKYTIVFKQPAYKPLILLAGGWGTSILW